MPQERPALLIIDMVKDYFDRHRPLPITPEAEAIMAPINALSAQFRRRDWPVIFATDAFQPDDFFFQGKLHPHALAGTEGAEIVDDLERGETDWWVPKPRMSAFFQTDLATRLRRIGVTLCAVTGIATPYCVLTSVLDALCHDFKAVMVSDCCAAHSRRLHAQTLETYRRNPLFPLLRVMTADELVSDLAVEPPGPSQQED
jgi:nicotinamidase/pyrazinamidase